MNYIWVGMILSGLVGAQVLLEQEPRHHLEFSNEFLRVISLEGLAHNGLAGRG